MGEVTNIKHRIGYIGGRFERGDQVFDVGTVLYNVTKGWPGKIHEVDRNNYREVFGVPPRDSQDAYHAWLALYNENTVGRYVRVMASDAKYPWLDLKFPTEEWVAATTYAADVLVYWESKVYQSQGADNTGNNPAEDDGTNWAEYDNDKGDWADATDYVAGDVVEDGGLLWVCQLGHTSVAATNKPTIDDGTNWLKYPRSGSSLFSAETSATGDSFMIAWLKNGATVDNQYGLAISDVDAATQTFKIGVYEKIDGVDYLIENSPFKVGLVEGARNADGSPLFVEAVFEQLSDTVGISLNGAPDFSAVFEHEEIVWFTGGTLGAAEPTLENYQTAWDMLGGEEVECDQLFMAGDTDAGRITAALNAAKAKDARVEADTPGGTAEADAAWAKALGLYSHLLSFTYGRVSFNDPFYSGSRKILGVSGFATAAKGWSREKNKTLEHPSVAEVPAGDEYGRLRGVSGIRNEKDLSASDIETLAENWINYIKKGKTGLMFWEQFTFNGEDSHLAYKRQVDFMNYVYKHHKGVMERYQFRQMTDQQIIDKLSPVLRHFYNKGVLIDGNIEEDEFDNKPFHIWIEQQGPKRQIFRMMRPSWAIGPIILETILA